MTDAQIQRAESALLEALERFAKTATTAADVEALAAVVQAFVELSRC